ncbi:MAG: tetratricopeptide repeat protein [Elusimicrobia bacterium]|nr:tetratricopeptide repeat protein [Elusimicrobiota bacterium]
MRRASKAALLAAALAAAANAPARAAAPAADAPYVPALPAATPEEGLSRLREAVARRQEDAALGEVYDFLKRYPAREEGGELRLAAGALHLRRGEFGRAAEFLRPLAQDAGSPLSGRATHLLGAALLALDDDAGVLEAVPAADPTAGADPWLARAQVWRAAAERNQGRVEDAARRDQALAEAGIESPVRAYAAAAAAADEDRRGRPERARGALARAEADAARWGLARLREVLKLSRAGLDARNGRLAEAAEGYARFAAEHPKSPLLAQALYERGLALKGLDRRADAAEVFGSLLRRVPGSVYGADAHLQLGLIAAEQGRAEQAAAEYRSMAEAAGTPEAGREALLLTARAYYNAKRWAEAVPLYRRALEGAADVPRTREVRGLLFVALWESDRADPELTALAEALPQHPLAPRVRWELAAAAYRRGGWAEAADRFGRELAVDPKGPRAADAAFHRAEALRQLGRGAEAANAYRDFLRAHPRHPRAKDAAARLDAEDADAARARAQALGESGAAAAAWEAFGRRWPRHPKAAWAWWQAGRLRERQGRTAQARSAYAQLRDAAPADDPARVSGLLRLGLLLELDDRPRQAAPLYVEILRRAGRRSPAFETARRRLQALTGDKSLLKR